MHEWHVVGSLVEGREKYRLELDEIAARCTVKEYGTGASPVPPVP